MQKLIFYYCVTSCHEFSSIKQHRLSSHRFCGSVVKAQLSLVCCSRLPMQQPWCWLRLQPLFQVHRWWNPGLFLFARQRGLTWLAHDIHKSCPNSGGSVTQNATLELGTSRAILELCLPQVQGRTESQFFLGSILHFSVLKPFRPFGVFIQVIWGD